MSRIRRHASEDEESSIDLTPMLDVVFIMLIFFIVTASFIKEAGIEITRPESNQPSDPADDNPNIVFQVSANNEIWLDGRRIDIRAVRANIARLHAERPEGAVIISASNKANADTFGSIADQAREAKVYNISLNTNDN